MNVSAPVKEPGKCAIKLISQLFSDEELMEGILFETKRSPKPALDPERVTKLFGKRNRKMHIFKYVFTTNQL
jgi:hypothetical protein